MARYNDITIKPNKTNRGNTGRTSQIYRGMSTISGNRNHKLYDIELIKQDLVNHFHIKKGEKIYQPDVGTIIWGLLFEPFTENVRQQIVSDIIAIVDGDPRIRIDAMEVVEKDYGIQVSCVLSFVEYNVSEALRLNFDRSNANF